MNTRTKRALLAASVAAALSAAVATTAAAVPIDSSSRTARVWTPSKTTVRGVSAGGSATAAKPAPKCPTPSTSVLRATPARYPKTVALTFDDGPGKFTPQILAVLKAKKVHATFFETGLHAKANPDLVRAVVAGGNKIGNHTETHPQNVAGSSPRASFDTLSVSVQSAQMDHTTAAIMAAAPTMRPCFFRAPGGHHFGATTIKLARARGMSVTHWTVDTMDWAQPAYSSKYYQDKIVHNATTGTGYHPIILMHDAKASPEPESKVSSNRSNSVAALGRVIDFYKARGYVFVDPAGNRI